MPVTSPGSPAPLGVVVAGAPDRHHLRPAAPPADQLRDRLLLPRHARRGSGGGRPRCRRTWSVATRSAGCPPDTGDRQPADAASRSMADGERYEGAAGLLAHRGRRPDRRLRRTALPRRRAGRLPAAQPHDPLVVPGRAAARAGLLDPDGAADQPPVRQLVDATRRVTRGPIHRPDRGDERRRDRRAGRGVRPDARGAAGEGSAGGVPPDRRPAWRAEPSPGRGPPGRAAHPRRPVRRAVRHHGSARLGRHGRGVPRLRSRGRRDRRDQGDAPGARRASTPRCWSASSRSSGWRGGSPTATWCGPTISARWTGSTTSRWSTCTAPPSRR